jgi:hypothetical protein
VPAAGVARPAAGDQKMQTQTKRKTTKAQRLRGRDSETQGRRMGRRMKDWRAGSKDLKTRSEEDERREGKERAFVSEAEGPFKRRPFNSFFLLSILLPFIQEPFERLHTIHLVASHIPWICGVANNGGHRKWAGFC